ncbi:MAG: hypothetical protein MJ063_01255 [Lachnospiraceae bacterium]|nr:hypothetical protein [Lachnospiraceae bacterium]
MKKKYLAIPLALLFAVSSFTSFAAGLVQNGDNWQYENTDGSLVYDTFKKIDGAYYYFDFDGNMAKDRLVDYEGSKYYVDGEGKKVINTWKKCAEEGEDTMYWFYFEKNGQAKDNGWLTWKENKYHFTDYHMDYGWYTDEEGNEYYLNAADDGHMETGWLPYTADIEIDPEEKHQTGWYYFLPSGKMVREQEKKIVTKFYAFDIDGRMIDGFGSVKNPSPEIMIGPDEYLDEYLVKYYDKVTGVRADGWRYVEGADDQNTVVPKPDGWYYLKKGVPLTRDNDTWPISESIGLKKIGNDVYAFNKEGKMVKGLVLAETDDEYNGKYYYFNEDGKMQTGYVKIEDLEEISVEAPAEYMYFNPKGTSIPYHGASVTGEVSSRLYENGVLVTAEKDRYELYTLSTGKTYVVSEKGTFVKSGTVKLENGDKMKISYDGKNYSWEKVN